MNQPWTNARQAYEGSAHRGSAQTRSAHIAAARAGAVHAGAARRARAMMRAEAVSDDPAAVRWLQVAYDDLTGIDGDIERILRNLQERHGYPRDLASMELMRRLSSLS